MSITFEGSPPTRDTAHFLPLQRSSSASSYSFRTSLPGCVATCRGVPECPGFVWTPFPGSGECSLLDLWHMTLRPINRAGGAHVVLRLGLLTSSAAATNLVAAVEGASTWSAFLAEEIITANQQLSKRFGSLPYDDKFWDFVAAVPNLEMSQGVSLRKSLYSLGMPVHPNVFRHMSYLQNYLSTSAVNASVGPLAGPFTLYFWLQHHSYF